MEDKILEVQTGKENEIESKKDILNSEKIKIFKYIFYILIAIVSFIVFLNIESMEYTLGDFGTIFPILIRMVSLISLKWIPILSILGIILTKLEKRFGLSSFSNSFFIVMIFVTVIAFCLLLVS